MIFAVNFTVIFFKFYKDIIIKDMSLKTVFKKNDRSDIQI